MVTLDRFEALDAHLLAKPVEAQQQTPPIMPRPFVGGLPMLAPPGVVNEPPTSRELLMARLIALSDPVLWLTVAAAVFGGLQPGERWTALVPVGIYAALQYLSSHSGSSALQLVLRSTGKIDGGH